MTQTADEILAEQLALIERDGDLHLFDAEPQKIRDMSAGLRRLGLILRAPQRNFPGFWKLSRAGRAMLDELRRAEPPAHSMEEF